MREKLTIHPIKGFGTEWEDDYIDPATFLPFDLTVNLTVEDISSLLNEKTFAFLTTSSSHSKEQQEALQGIKYALVRRFNPSDPGASAEAEREMSLAMACLRLVKPTREYASHISGEIADGSFLADGASVLHEMVEVPASQKLNDIHLADLKELKRLLPNFFKANDDSTSCWRIRIATQLHQGGHFASGTLWKARYILWAAALEAMYTSDCREDSGNAVIKARVLDFLGEATQIYSSAELRFTGHDPGEFTVGSIVADCLKVRNMIAHGSRIPGEWFVRGRKGISGHVTYPEVLMESLSFMVRQTIRRVLADDSLLAAFTPEDGVSKYFKARGLVRSKLKKP